LYHSKLSKKLTLSIEEVAVIQKCGGSLLNDSVTLWKKDSESAGAIILSDFLYQELHTRENEGKTMDSETLRKYLFKEVEIVQNVISRMGSNSFLIKGWAVTLIVASLIVQGASYHHYVALLPWFVFWCLDAYFLRTERLYRKLYDWLIINRQKSDEFLLDMNKKSLEKRFGKEVSCILQVMFSKTLVAFYGALLVIIIVSVYVDLYILPLNLSAI